MIHENQVYETLQNSHQVMCELNTIRDRAVNSDKHRESYELWTMQQAEIAYRNFKYWERRALA